MRLLLAVVTAGFVGRPGRVVPPDQLLPVLSFKDLKEAPPPLYAALGVHPSASPTLVKKAYRERVLRWHPFLSANRDAAEAKFQEIGDAYATLRDPELRKRYDDLQQFPASDAHAEFRAFFANGDPFRHLFPGDRQRLEALLESEDHYEHLRRLAAEPRALKADPPERAPRRLFTKDLPQGHNRHTPENAHEFDAPPRRFPYPGKHSQAVAVPGLKELHENAPGQGQARHTFHGFSL